MHVIVFGAGAIGGVIGGRLFEHGHDVTLVARGPHLDSLRADGLRLESPEGTATLPVPAVGAVADARHGPGDLVLLAMKGQDTDGALRDLSESFPPETPIACAQNGVSNERAALRMFPNVYGVCVMLPATHLEPGVVQASSAPITGLLDVGRYPAGSDDTAAELAGVFAASTFDSNPLDDIMRWKHTKLLMNLGNAVDAMCARGDASTELAKRARREGAAVLTAAGVDFASREEDAARRGDLMTMRPIDGKPRGGGSTWQSLARGTGSLESDHLNGEIVLLGRLHGVPTPVNELLQREAAAAGRRKAAPGSVDAAALLASLPG